MSKKKKLIGTAVLTAVLIAAGVGAGSRLLARYVSNNREKAEMTSSQFHFTSDYLEEPTGLLVTSEPKYDIMDWGDGFDILLYNYEKENLAQIAADDITYTVSISKGWLCDMANSDGNLTDVSGNHQEWEGTFKSTAGTGSSEADRRKSQKLRIKSDGTETGRQGKDIEVTVTTTSPYKKTLSAKFHVATKRSPEFTFEDQNDGSVLLTVKSNDYSGEIHVMWKKDQYDPDRTNNMMSSWEEDDGTEEDAEQDKTLNLSAHTTYELLFFKQENTGKPKLDSYSGTYAKLQ